jgi:hypothetical protein
MARRQQPRRRTRRTGPSGWTRSLRRWSTTERWKVGGRGGSAKTPAGSRSDCRPRAWSGGSSRAGIGLVCSVLI